MKYSLSILFSLVFFSVSGQDPCSEEVISKYTITSNYHNYTRVSRCFLSDTTFDFTKIDSLIYVDFKMDSSIVKLKNAKVIHFINPELNEIAKEIGKLNQLTYISFELSTFDILPDEFWSLPQLEVLHFNKCFKFDSIPNAVSNLKNLKVFTHTYGPSIYLDPKSFAGFQKPMIISFKYSKIDDATIEELSKLENCIIE